MARSLNFVLVLLASLSTAGSVQAQSLNKALASAYANNPTLGADRARQRATDEQVSQANSGWRPTVTASGDYGYRRVITKPSTGNFSNDTGGVSVALNQPIFRGFRTVNSSKQAEATVRAGQQVLLSTEQQVLFDGVTAYMNVVRDQSVVRLREEDVRVLREQLRGTESRFKVGELTRTDVAQSRARLSRANSDLAVARANLAASRADFVRVIGMTPTRLRFPKSVAKRLPKSLKQALALAEATNPNILTAKYNEEASRHAIEVAVGELLPELNLQAQYSFRNKPSSVFSKQETATVLGQLNVPIYQQGAEYSRVREAKQLNNERQLQIMEARRVVRDEVVTAWNLLHAARQQIVSDRTQVSANELAFKGIQQEALVGSRTVLDVLDTNRDLIGSRVALVGSQRDEVVASFRLLAAIGRLTARQLGLPVRIYDPNKHLEEVRWKFIGLGNGESD